MGRRRGERVADGTEWSGDGILEMEREAWVAEAVRRWRGDAGEVHIRVVGRGRNVVAWEGATGEALRVWVVEDGPLWRRDLAGCLSVLLRVALSEFGLKAAAARGRFENGKERHDGLPELVLDITVGMIKL